MPKIKNKKKSDSKEEKSPRAKRASDAGSPHSGSSDKDSEGGASVPSLSVEPAGPGARSAAEGMDDPIAEQNTVELLFFRLADEEYAVDLLKIKEIIRLTEITFVPRAPKYIEGIISLRGAVIPIFDMRDRIGLRKLPPTRKSRIIIAKLENGLMGFITDEVTDVMKVAPGDIDSAPGSKAETDHLIGVLHIKDKMVIYMDMEQTVGIKAAQ